MPHLLTTAVLAGMSAVAVAQAAWADWPTDASAALVVADDPGSQAQPKIRAAGDGGAYVGYLDGSAGYAPRLQRVDARGNVLWAGGGVVLGDRSDSSAQDDLGLSVDGAGNALMAYRLTGVGVGVNKVAPDGTKLWGSGGVLNATAAFTNAPRVVGASDGSVVAGWSQGNAAVLQKYDANGVPQWGAGVTESPTTGTWAMSDMAAADSGSVIVLFVKITGSTRQLATQKYAPDGARLWGAGLKAVFDAGSMQIGYAPLVRSDGAGGAVYGGIPTATRGTCGCSASTRPARRCSRTTAWRRSRT